MGWEQKMKETPPSRARAMAMRSSDTDCMTAETRGMFIERGGSSPRRKRHRGVRSETFAGTQSVEE